MKTTSEQISLDYSPCFNNLLSYIVCLRNRFSWNKQLIIIQYFCIKNNLYIKLQFLNPARWPARSKARVSGFDRVSRINFFSKHQNDVILFKKQKSTGCNRVFDRVLPGSTGSAGFFLFLFFLQLDPVSATDRSGRGSTCLVKFQNYI